MVTLEQIAKIVDGKIIGDSTIQVKGLESYRFAKEGDITFALNEEDLKLAGDSEASCVLTTINVEKYPKTLLCVNDIKLGLTVLYNAMLEMQPPKKGEIHSSATIANTVVLGNNVTIGSNASIGERTSIGDNSIIAANSVIGKDVVVGQETSIYPNVTIYDRSVIGNNVGIHSGTVIGADGFGYIPREDKIYKVPQMGRVIIEDNVEIGANSCIDRGSFVDTVISKDTKIDNLVQIAHNVKLGQKVLLAAQVGIAGSSTVGDNTMMGGQAGVGDHINIGTNVKIAAKAGVIRHVKDDGPALFGYPARDIKKHMKERAFVSMLYRNAKKIRKLMKGVSE